MVCDTGFTSSDFWLEDTSESFGLPATADFMIALIATEELSELNQVLVKQLKNRYSDASSNRKFILGINKAKMSLYDPEDSAQSNTGQGQDGCGKGFDGKNFDDMFTKQKVSKDKFVDWKV